MYMNSNDLNGLGILTKINERRLKQSKAARILGISGSASCNLNISPIHTPNKRDNP